MSPRDIGQQRALIVSSDPIETLDLVEYLRARGWASPVVVGMAQEALNAIETRTEHFALLLLAVSPTHPASGAIIRRCRSDGSSDGSAVVLFDGAHSLADQGSVAVVDRPFTDRDLDAALAMLGCLPV